MQAYSSEREAMLDLRFVGVKAAQTHQKEKKILICFVYFTFSHTLFFLEVTSFRHTDRKQHVLYVCDPITSLKYF